MSSPEQQKASTSQHRHFLMTANPSQPIGAGVQPDMGNIDKIREILFGGHMRDYDRRFSRVEEQLVKESLELREDTRKRFEALEAFVKADSLRCLTAFKLNNEPATTPSQVYGAAYKSRVKH